MKIFNDLQLAKELIKFPTVTPVDAEIMKFLEKKLKLIGFKTKFFSLRTVIVHQLKTFMLD